MPKLYLTRLFIIFLPSAFRLQAKMAFVLRSLSSVRPLISATAVRQFAVDAPQATTRLMTAVRDKAPTFSRAPGSDESFDLTASFNSYTTSLTVCEFVACAEAEFAIDIDNAAADKFASLADIAAHVAERTDAK
jgi:acyl carrier protein